jgi:UPF0716 family protein affecting phage T7 exclusion
VVLLVFLFIAIPILELYVIIEIGGLIGVLPTLALLLACSLLGAMLLRHQGRGAWRRFNAAIAEQRFPGREVADGLLITIGGALLLTPGFVRRLLRAYFSRRFVVMGVAGARAAPRYDSARRPYDFDATAEEIREDDRRLSG